MESVDRATPELEPEYSRKLFELLRTERDRITEAEGVLPYEVFHDKALQAMATYFPISEESFRQMPSVGPAKTEKYADVFLPIIREYLKKQGTDSEESGSQTSNTYEPVSDEPNEYAPELFELLRAKRKTVADDGEVPAFVVFSNKTLEAMATYFPQTEEELQQIYGVGPAKVEKYADAFLPIIRDYCKEYGID